KGSRRFPDVDHHRNRGSHRRDIPGKGPGLVSAGRIGRVHRRHRRRGPRPRRVPHDPEISAAGGVGVPGRAPAARTENRVISGMSIAAGSRIGPYEILSPLGAGGMGEVYRARDTRLHRDVAVKALSPEFAGDAERLARFQREARLLASLNHPNIAAIYGLEEDGGANYLVLEIVEGESLSQRLAAGPLPVEEALAIGAQIAAGVSAAHEAGVIHRDLKPGNVMIRPDGSVKVLDFGLAKGAEKPGAVSDLSASPTVSLGTQAGVILGTAAYMSPEQTRGRALDKRTD